MEVDGCRPFRHALRGSYADAVSRCIRSAAERDAHAIQRIENDADRLLIDRLHPEVWAAAPTGAARLSEPGFLLVIDVDGEVAGFVHVLELHGVCHLEQLSVDPRWSRQGLGRALVEAAKDLAGECGHRRISLRTYADVPWNAPFYRTAGFVEEEPATAFHRSLVVVEAEHGLDRYGRRVQMSAPLTQARP